MERERTVARKSLKNRAPRKRYKATEPVVNAANSRFEATPVAGVALASTSRSHIANGQVNSAPPLRSHRVPVQLQSQTQSTQSPNRIGYQQKTTARKSVNATPNSASARRQPVVSKMTPSPPVVVKTSRIRTSTVNHETSDSDDHRDTHKDARVRYPRLRAMAVPNRTSGYRRVTTEDVEEIRGHFDANLNIVRHIPRQEQQGAVNGSQPIQARMAARKKPDGWSESESGSSSQSDSDQSLASRSQDVPEENEEVISDSDSERLIDPPTRAVEPILSTIQLAPAPSNLHIEIHDAPTPELIAAFKASITWLPASNLPFLRRNIRRGFVGKCQANGTNMASQSGDGLRVIYISCQSVEKGYARDLDGWECPMCLMFPGGFDNRDMLKNHLEWDHVDINVVWKRNRSTRSWTIEIRFPDRGKESPLAEREAHPHFAYGTYKTAIQPESLLPEPEHEPEPERIPSSAKGKGRAAPPIPFSPSRDASVATSHTLDSVSTTPAPSKKLFSSTSPTRSSFHPTPTPPARNPLGPRAQPPFIPAISGDRKIQLNYSCRPGGSRIYDLLGTLSLEPFGVLKWLVIDREEEIFEVDDLKDEYKVMHALWARWILLNRTLFVANYGRGVKLFIDEYMEMIKLAAGWEALRYWLLMLLAHRYLTGKDVADALRYYEEKGGLDD
ncbi:hypothetical protein VNI00_003268 [Paramarasmius palmivorus]|uniref:Polycomb protein VEFS-Box domain-containing protein n=1 Tax=Paramarasmius palmivorus TaxID=297713 RepID=A0AAW0DU12_9AGAR